MQILRDVLKQAEENRVAIGHFNVGDLVLLRAVFAAAQELKVPVIIGASEGEREFFVAGPPTDTLHPRGGFLFRFALTTL